VRADACGCDRCGCGGRREETGERRRFSSAILPPWCRKSPKINEVLPLLYLHGLPSSDFVPPLEKFSGHRVRASPPRRSLG
jgi:hypothetical protein